MDDGKRLFSRLSVALFAISMVLGATVLLALAFSASDSPLSHHHWGTTALVAFIPSAAIGVLALYFAHRATH